MYVVSNLSVALACENHKADFPIPVVLRDSDSLPLIEVSLQGR